ncbi:ImmA/IrrE family metallo-endopeptidase [Rhizobium laguerreae]|uniref:ImmA/IrrE family metallo-endopeptidase n=1 Tax=Rhizobium laguerreae TaxID=1076926 RepID=UPI00143F0E69|nr:ImmA/IrrE family metallo-endopeptidase [Rhizobium laguerreae]NKM14171.1 ImmA/IrrE family metallo-endopeptidase [Rhizobium laguerreae]
MADLRDKLETLNTYIGFREPPIDVVGLANLLGIKVYDAPWPESVSGKIQKDERKGGSSGFAIFVRESDPETRKRFTIAHEIAHYVLHEHLIGDGVFDDAMYRSGLASNVERQANNLAADILMPWSYLTPMINGKTAKDLAETFNVSEQAMQVRLGIFA